ncbi:unnamed protein product, partial [Prorocentrum cordatum]
CLPEDAHPSRACRHILREPRLEPAGVPSTLPPSSSPFGAPSLLWLAASKRCSAFRTLPRPEPAGGAGAAQRRRRGGCAGAASLPARRRARPSRGLGRRRPACTDEVAGRLRAPAAGVPGEDGLRRLPLRRLALRGPSGLPVRAPVLPGVRPQGRDGDRPEPGPEAPQHHVERHSPRGALCRAQPEPDEPEEGERHARRPRHLQDPAVAREGQGAGGQSPRQPARRGPDAPGAGRGGRRRHHGADHALDGAPAVPLLLPEPRGRGRLLLHLRAGPERVPRPRPERQA